MKARGEERWYPFRREKNGVIGNIQEVPNEMS